MVVGGPLGISQRLLARADFVLSLSKMTFPHDLARLMVMEQAYRAFTILKGEPYHK
jgi:23S rRNA (pseudouridine1915-N3)-methyltransferase